MKINAERQKISTKNTASKKNILRLSVLAAGAALASAFTVPGCPDVDALNGQISQMQVQVNSSDRKHNDLVNQFKTINDEHNTMKQLINQVSESALAQKAQIEALQAEVKTLNEKLAKAPAPRSSAPTRLSPTKPIAKPKTTAPIRRR